MSTNYYAAIIRATRSSANALAAMSRINRQIADAKRNGHDITKFKRAYTNAHTRYLRAQDILHSRPLPADDIAARQADYPKARD